MQRNCQKIVEDRPKACELNGPKKFGEWFKIPVIENGPIGIRHRTWAIRSCGNGESKHRKCEKAWGLMYKMGKMK